MQSSTQKSKNPLSPSELNQKKLQRVQSAPDEPRVSTRNSTKKTTSSWSIRTSKKKSSSSPYKAWIRVLLVNYFPSSKFQSKSRIRPVNPQVIDYKEKSGFFSKERVYSIKTSPINFIVKRNVADILLLQKSLEKNFLFMHVPKFIKNLMYNRNQFDFQQYWHPRTNPLARPTTLATTSRNCCATRTCAIRCNSRTSSKNPANRTRTKWR